MFAVITPALISGAFAERMRFTAYVAFVPALGDVRLRPRRALGLGGRRLARQAGRARLRGRHRRAPHGGRVRARLRARARQARSGTRKSAAPAQPPDDPHGAALLWFGWFGFNAGSALGAMGSRRAFINTHLGAAGGALGWLVIEWAHSQTERVGVASGPSPGSSRSRLPRDTSLRGRRSHRLSLERGLLPRGARQDRFGSTTRSTPSASTASAGSRARSSRASSRRPPINARRLERALSTATPSSSGFRRSPSWRRGCSAA